MHSFTSGTNTVLYADKRHRAKVEGDVETLLIVQTNNPRDTYCSLLDTRAVVNLIHFSMISNKCWNQKKMEQAPNTLDCNEATINFKVFILLNLRLGELDNKLLLK